MSAEAKGPRSVEHMGDSRELPPYKGVRVRWCGMCRDVEVWRGHWDCAPREVLLAILRRNEP